MEGCWEGELPATTPPVTAPSSATHSRSSSRSRTNSHSNSSPSTPISSALAQASRRFLECTKNGSVTELTSLLSVLPSDIKRSNSRSAVFNAISSQSADTVEILLRDLVEDGYLQPAPGTASRRQSSESTQPLLPPSPKPSSGNYVVSCAQFFDAPVASNGWTPLMVAASLGQVQIVKALLRAGASASATVHMCALNPVFATKASSVSRAATPKLEGSSAPVGPPSPLALDGALPLSIPTIGTLSSGSNSAAKCQPQCGMSPVHVAAHAGHTACIPALVRAGADVKGATRDGTFPLLLAAQEGHVDACRELLAQGADPNQLRRDGVTALYKAVEKSHADTVEVLLAPIAGERAHDADDNEEDRPPMQIVCTNLDPVAADGLTPLFVAVLKRNHALTKRLLEAKARPEPPCERVTMMGGRVPLHYAAAAGDKSLCQLLIDHRAQVNAYDDKGVTPAAVARSKQHTELAEWLVLLARVGTKGLRKHKRAASAEAAEESESESEGEGEDTRRGGEDDEDGASQPSESTRPTSSLKRIKVAPRVHKRSVAIPSVRALSVEHGAEAGVRAINWAQDSDEAILAALDRAQQENDGQ